jgi:hypothetical protein
MWSESVIWIKLAQDQVEQWVAVNTVIEAPSYIKLWELIHWMSDCPFLRFLLSEVTKQMCCCCYYFVVVVFLLLLALLFPRTQVTDAVPACILLLLRTDEQHNTDWEMRLFYKVVSSCQMADGCLDWSWGNGSLATMIVWFNTPGLFCVEIR